jgi:benzoyl-CoA reductase/2-hydroxyglutaryl-CoA dehydratase subunit BcrC/BadD/HgdB
MKSAEECRAKATECENRAEVASDATVRADYRNMAYQWRLMAEQIEELEAERQQSNRVRTTHRVKQRALSSGTRVGSVGDSFIFR